MNSLNPKVDLYFEQGCGRCPLGNTPQCKVHTWVKEMQLLRSILLDCGLTEEIKWGVPCYTWQSKNILTSSAFKEHCAIGFFKGSLLADPHNLLTKPSENSHEGRVMRFTNAAQIEGVINELKSYIFEAIEIEKLGLKIAPKPVADYAVPVELEQRLNENPAFKAAFKALTPGRQKGYLLHFSQPKQAQTRFTRIDNCTDKIFDGKGLNDR